MMKKIFCSLLAAHCSLLIFSARAEDPTVDVESYDVEGSLFQRIADLEQEKVLMQLEKEKAQLQLDLDRLASEQSRLVREQESADMRAEEQAAEIEKQRAAIEEERKKLDDQKRRLAEEAARKVAAKEDDEPAPQKSAEPAAAAAPAESESAPAALADKYYLVEIIGAGNQLVATVENLGTGKQKKLSVGKALDGHNVRAISLDDGIELEKDGEITYLGVGSFGSAGEE